MANEKQLSNPNPTSNPLDETDVKILELLQKNARIPNTELADAVNLTPAPCLRRVKRLEQDGYILGYHAALAPDKLEGGLLVLVMVTLDRQTKAGYEHFAQQMRQHPQVLECHLLLGDRDFLLKVRVKDLQTYQQFYLRELTNLEGIRNINSMIVVDAVFERPLEVGHL